MNKSYTKPVIVVNKIENADVITASSAVEPTLPNKDNEFNFDDLY